MSILTSLPQDVIRKCAIVTLMGKTQLYIENFKTILEYDNEIVKIRTFDGVVVALGTNLKIQYYNSEEIKITGIISEIRFGV